MKNKMGKKLTPEEQRLVDIVIEEMKKLVKKFGFEYVKIGATKYLNHLKEKTKLLNDIKEREKELAKLKDGL